MVAEEKILVDISAKEHVGSYHSLGVYENVM
jgi:hypothetical protein